MFLKPNAIGVSLPDLLVRCRCCESKDLFLFLPMGLHPPATAFVSPERAQEPQAVFPLDAKVCLSCGLVQVAGRIPETICERSSCVLSDDPATKDRLESLALNRDAGAGHGPIVEIGCNEVLILSAANRSGARTLGHDIATDGAAPWGAPTVEVLQTALTEDSARRIAETHGRAMLVVTASAFNHIGDLHAFMRAVAILLADDGTLVIEVPWCAKILQGNQFDTLCHERLSEVSLLSIRKLVAATDMDIVDVQLLPVHGGSMRVHIRRTHTGEQPSAAVTAVLDAEAAAGLTERATWEAFSTRVDAVRNDLVRMIDALRADGKTVVGYGAPARGNTLLNYFDLGADRIDFLVDPDPLKQNMLTPGTLIPVYPIDVLAEKKPDVMLILAWNLLDEIIEQQAAFRSLGGQFLVPLPKPRLI